MHVLYAYYLRIFQYYRNYDQRNVTLATEKSKFGVTSNVKCFIWRVMLRYIAFQRSYFRQNYPYHRLDNLYYIQHKNCISSTQKFHIKAYAIYFDYKSTKKLTENKNFTSFYKKSFSDFIARTDLASILIYWWRLQHQTSIDRVLAACYPFAVFININIFYICGFIWTVITNTKIHDRYMNFRHQNSWHYSILHF